jgi:hypothetical protein
MLGLRRPGRSGCGAGRAALRIEDGKNQIKALAKVSARKPDMGAGAEGGVVIAPRAHVRRRPHDGLDVKSLWGMGFEVFVCTLCANVA